MTRSPRIDALGHEGLILLCELVDELDARLNRKPVGFRALSERAALNQFIAAHPEARGYVDRARRIVESARRASFDPHEVPPLFGDDSRHLGATGL